VRCPPKGAFWNHSTSSTPHAAFDPPAGRINACDPGSASGGYQVRAGETPGSIAANLWG
jgi:hypothetical protein